MASNAAFVSLLIKNIYVVAVLFPLSLVIFTYERTLVPLFGSGPTCFLLNKFVVAGILAAALNPIHLKPSRNWLCLALALSLAPNANYWIAVWTGRLKDAVLGPAITHLVVLVPLVFFLSTPVMVLNNRLTRAPIKLRLTRTAIIYILSEKLAHSFWPQVAHLNRVSDSKIVKYSSYTSLMDWFHSPLAQYLDLAGVFYNLWILATTSSARNVPNQKKTKTKRVTASGVSVTTKLIALVLFSTIWWTLNHYLDNPVLPHPLSATFAHPRHPLVVHSAVQSITGLITVAEWLPPSTYKGESDREMHSARYLRASHSILGGVWTKDKVQVLDDEPPLTDSFGNPLGDSIYSTFILQEAVRLVDSTEKGKKGKWDNALVIGLGVGTSATSFMRHGISATIVEIDPAVYTAAKTYFGLPDPGPDKVFLEDARLWTARQRAAIDLGKKLPLYDIVVHDCFSGGGVPQQLFTLEFWDDLKAVMEPEGIVVVNFAGMIKSESSSLVVNTLLKSFGQCRAFHDVFEDLSNDNYETEFVNMVLFCTRSSSPLTFRGARTSDFLGSPLRRHILSSLWTREVDLNAIKDDNEKYILTNDHNPLGRLQEKQGNHHWEVMRQVLPDYHWEIY